MREAASAKSGSWIGAGRAGRVLRRLGMISWEVSHCRRASTSEKSGGVGGHSDTLLTIMYQALRGPRRITGMGGAPRAARMVLRRLLTLNDCAVGRAGIGYSHV